MGIKIWNINNLDNILTINKRNNEFAFIYPCFINDNNQIYIILNIIFYNNYNKVLRVIDFKGKLKKDINIIEINDRYKSVNYMICYYDDKSCKNYIIAYIEDIYENNNFILSIDYNENKVYNKYYFKDVKYSINILMYNKEELKMIESSGKCNIRIWDFHSGKLLQTINIPNCIFYGLSLWDDENLLVSCKSKEIKIIKINGGKMINLCSNSKVYFAQKVFHPQYGECLMSQNSDYSIKIFVDKNIIIK